MGPATFKYLHDTWSHACANTQFRHTHTRAHTQNLGAWRYIISKETPSTSSYLQFGGGSKVISASSFWILKWDATPQRKYHRLYPPFSPPHPPPPQTPRKKNTQEAHCKDRYINPGRKRKRNQCVSVQAETPHWFPNEVQGALIEHRNKSRHTESTCKHEERACVCVCAGGGLLLSSFCTSTTIYVWVRSSPTDRKNPSSDICPNSFVCVRVCVYM